MKKTKKILLIIIITFISIILLEYLYSQRWRLTKSVPVEQYPEYFVGGWGYEVKVGSFLYPIYLEKVNIGSSEDPGVFGYGDFIIYPDPLRGSTLFPYYVKIEGSDLIGEKPFPANRVLVDQKTILHLNEDYLVFDEPSNSLFAKIIPRKESYRRLDK